MRKCKCYYCGEVFDRDKEPYEQVTAARYAHKRCAEKHAQTLSKNEQDYNALIQYVEKLFGIGYVSVKVIRQIKEYREQYGYTYNGMLGTLVYWFEIKKGSIEKANGGIGIIPWQYEEAKNYFLALNRANAINADIHNFQYTIKEIEIYPPRPEEKKIKLFNFDGEDSL